MMITKPESLLILVTIFLFFGYYELSKKNFLMESTFVSSSEHNSAHTFNDPREQLNTKLILSVPINRSINLVLHIFTLGSPCIIYKYFVYFPTWYTFIFLLHLQFLQLFSTCFEPAGPSSGESNYTCSIWHLSLIRCYLVRGRWCWVTAPSHQRPRTR